jgi:hypothetical protein
VGCTPIVLGDLNINIDIGFPWDKREEIIVDLLEEINLLDMLRTFKLWLPNKYGGHVRFTWSQKWGKGRTSMKHYLQPDYCLVQEGEQSNVKGMRFRFL